MQESIANICKCTIRPAFTRVCSSDCQLQCCQRVVCLQHLPCLFLHSNRLVQPNLQTKASVLIAYFAQARMDLPMIFQHVDLQFERLSAL